MAVTASSTVVALSLPVPDAIGPIGRRTGPALAARASRTSNFCSSLTGPSLVRDGRLVSHVERSAALSAAVGGLDAKELRSPARPVSVSAAGTQAPASEAPASEMAPTVPDEEEIVIPRRIEDISNGEHIMGFGANLAEDHPGYHDEDYKKRRTFIADLAKSHVMGTPIPKVDYTDDELYVWRTVFNELTKLYSTHACQEYLATFPLFDFQADVIPQLQDVSEILQQKTGWRVRPVAGLLHPRDFLNGLAFRTFHSTQYVRHKSNPMYTPEPDVCHELLGHVPMLADLGFADLAYQIGLASLGANKKEIWQLTKLYWYTVEFGTILEQGQVKAFGAGLLSSFGELQYMQSGTEDGKKPQFLDLDPFAKLPKMSYKEGFQKTYFLCSSFNDAAEKLHSYAATLHRPELVPQ
eukprot:SM000077S21572  [mRNA]  locus=s77:243545:245756:- [translate_table: standard]